jgi:tetratricopeptide (TPR) repeat protein
LSCIAECQSSAGKLDLAERTYSDAIARLRAARRPDLGAALLGMGEVLMAKSAPEKAERYLDEATAILASQSGLAATVACTRAFRLLGECLDRQGRSADAVLALTVCIDRLKDAGASARRERFDCELLLARALLRAGDATASEHWSRDAAAAAADDDWSGETARRARAESLVGASLARQGRAAEAEPLLRDGLERLQAQAGSEDLWIDLARDALVDVYVASTRPDAALAATCEPTR